MFSFDEPLKPFHLVFLKLFKSKIPYLELKQNKKNHLSFEYWRHLIRIY
jgi:hypothetical protein